MGLPSCEEAHRLSGGGKRLAYVREKLYASLELPKYKKMPFVRNTKVRFDQFGIYSLIEQTFVDLGCNVGALCWEAHNRAADFIYGFEYNAERVVFCSQVAEYYKMQAAFHETDFRIGFPTYPEGATVMCCSVDTYVDHMKLYRDIRASNPRVLYFESDRQDAHEDEVTEDLEECGFSVSYIGNGDSGGISRKRKVFICTPV